MFLLASPALAAEPALRPLDDFLARAARSLVVMSPDGQRLAWQPWDGAIGRLVVADADATGPRDVPGCGDGRILIGWAGTRALLCRGMGDVSDWLLTDVDGGGQVELTNARAVTPEVGGRLFVAGPVSDASRAALTAMGLTVASEPDARAARVVEDGDRIVGVMQRSRLEDPGDPIWWGSTRLFAVDGGRRRSVLFGNSPVPWRGMLGVDVRPRAWDRDALVIDGNRSPWPAIEAVNLDSGSVRDLFSPERGVIAQIVQDPRTGAPLAAGVRDERLHWHALEPSVSGDLARISAALPADDDWAPMTVSDDGTRWLLLTTGPTHSFRQYLYDRPGGTLGAIPGYADAFDARPWRPTRALTFPTRDGKTVGAYLTTPDPERYGPGPWPLVLEGHGGPWDERELWGWDFGSERLAEVGDAVLRVNYRGSAEAGVGLNRDATLEGAAHDFADAVEAMVAAGVATRDRVAMLGTSYGAITIGEITLVEPDLLRCAVMNSGYGWASRTAPKTRLLVLQGGSDSIVSPARVSRYVEGITRAGAKPLFVTFPGSEHDVLSHEEAGAAWTLTERFLGDCLDRPSGPLDLAGVRMEVRTGLDTLPGLADAVRAAVGQRPSGLPTWLMAENHSMLPPFPILRGE